MIINVIVVVVVVMSCGHSGHLQLLVIMPDLTYSSLSCQAIKCYTHILCITVYSI